jgi:hypothetical protein
MTRVARLMLGLIFVLSCAACSPGGGGQAQPDGPAATPVPAASSGY